LMPLENRIKVGDGTQRELRVFHSLELALNEQEKKARPRRPTYTRGYYPSSEIFYR